MSKPTKPARKPTSNEDGQQSDSKSGESKALRQQFLSGVLTMSWQLAVAVLIPILVGVKLDHVFGTHDTLTFIGLGLAVVGAALVMWRTMKRANRLPVPVLSAAQKQAIKKSYEEDDANE